MTDWFVKDKFLTPRYFNTIKDFLEGNNFAWFFMPEISGEQLEATTKETAGFQSFIIDVHGNPREHYTLMWPFICQVMDAIPNSVSALRCRADMVLGNDKPFLHTPHIDIPKRPHYSCVFYINESDGNTVLYNERSDSNVFFKDKLTVMTEVEPKPNRLVVFRGDIIHTGNSPVKHQRRIIINTNIEVDKYDD